MKKRYALVAVLLFAAVIVSACSNYKFKATTHYEVEDFQVTNHRGEEVGLEDFKGKPWLAMFIFTNCTTVCTPMTYNMTEVQHELIDRGVEDYNIVAFSVDPATDKPAVLTDYLKRYDVPDESKWNLLTGYDQKFIEQFALNSFKTLVRMPTDPKDNQVLHQSLFFLVDENGVAVKNYTGASMDGEEISYDTIAIDMETLIEEGSQ